MILYRTMASYKILIVDDEFVVGLDLKERLESIGYTVIGISSSGKDAISLCKKYNPDLVLMDIVIKGDIDGIDTAKMIKDQFNIPVIYLTAYADNRTIKDAMVTEPYGYLIKPVQERELKSAIEIAIYKVKTEKRLTEGQKITSALADLVPGLLFVTDLRGRFTLINSDMEKVLSLPAGETLGKKAGDYVRIRTETGIIDPADYMGLAASDLDVVENDGGMIIKGKENPVNGRMVVRNVRDENGNLIGVIYILTSSAGL